MKRFATIVPILTSLSILFAAPWSLAATLIFSEGFESGNLNQWDTEFAAGCSVATATPRSGTHYEHCNRASGSNNQAFGLTSSSHTGYLSFWEKMSTGLNPSAIPGSCAGHWWRLYGPGWQYEFDNEMHSCGGTPQMEIATLFYGPSGGGWDTGEFWQGGTISMADGAWHHYEAQYRQNTPGQADGWFKMWQDGRLFHQRQNITMLPSNYNGSLFDTLALPSNSGIQAGTFIDVDDIELWDGCPTATLYSGTSSCSSGKDSVSPAPPTNLTVYGN
jgi:hypothetical protein